MMLSVRGLNQHYGRIHVIHDLSLEVGSRESVGLFGPNGAGKTTLINAIMGLVKPSGGDITFEGRILTGLETHEIVRAGVALVPQERELFPYMSVLGNLEAGADYVPRTRGLAAQRLELVFSLFPVLQARRRQLAGTLSGGEQRMLAIGRALMSSPRFLILDEPSLGLQPSLVSELFGKLAEMRGEVSILLAEQNVRESLKAVDRGYVLENGRVAFEDSARGLAGNEHVVKAYLGV
jgi:branched-chain amino acid transport system ATP-binding protein